jgi:hypothetical protein
MNNSTSDQGFLNNYIRFAAVHRWRVANACFERFLQTDDKSAERAHLALEIFFCYLLLMEDILMWYYVLKGFQTPSNANLMDSLDAVKLSPDRRKTALEEMEQMSANEFMTLLGFLPTDGALQLGLSAEEYEAQKGGVVALKQRLQDGIRIFLRGKDGALETGTFVRCLNKIKHGLLVMRVAESPAKPEFVAIFPNGTRFDSSVDQFPPEVYTQKNESEMILSEIAVFTVVLVGMLAVLYRSRFRCPPEGCLPEELEEAIRARADRPSAPPTTSP